MNSNDTNQKMEQKKKMHKGLVIVFLAVLVTLACTCGNMNLPPAISNLLGGNTATATGEAAASNILLQDDFSDPNSGWEVEEFEDGSVGYADGTYFVTSTVANKAMWGMAGKSFTDATIEVTATQINGPANNNNDYGVMCRLTETTGYSFNISGDGYYSIQKITDGSFSNLVEWTASSEINTGNTTNTIKATCSGSTLTLYVNGNKLAEVTDTTYTSGDIALATTTYESEASEVHFDDLLVTVP